MGWNEWPLMMFTAMAQGAVGAFWWCSLALLVAPLAPDVRLRLEKSMLPIWIMMGLAFAISSAHLGSPMRGVNASFRFLQAPLSNEIVFGGMFAAVGFLHWLMSWRRVGGAALRTVVLALALACSFAFLWNMAQFYRIPTVPTWDTPLTPAAFLVTTLLLGGAVATALFSWSNATLPPLLRAGPLVVAAVAMCGALAVVLLQSSLLADINSSVNHAAALSPHYGLLMAARFVLLGLALALWVSQVVSSRAKSGLGMAMTVVCLIATGEIIGRGVFYALHMTVGMV